MALINMRHNKSAFLAFGLVTLALLAWGGTLKQRRPERPLYYEVVIPAEYERTLFRKNESPPDGKVSGRIKLPLSSWHEARFSAHGSSDLEETDRKSLHVEFKDPVELLPGHPAKDFFLLSSAEDPCFTHLPFAYRMAGRLGLFHSAFDFAVLKINGRPPRLALAVENPTRVLATGEKDATLAVLRSDYDNSFILKYLRRESGRPLVRSAINTIIDALTRLDGPAQAARLRSVMDLDAYLDWLALNRILRNGDSTDELFWAATVRSRDKQEFAYFDRFHGWDYEQIFETRPRHGIAALDSDARPSLVFSGESALDRSIAANPELYAAYLARLRADLALLAGLPLKQSIEEIGTSIQSAFEHHGDQVAYGTSPKKIQECLRQLESDTEQEFSELRQKLRGAP